jgi:lipopolysaccharide transport system ATP-binding protein
MSALAISVEKISKVYRLGEINRGQLLGDIRRWLAHRLKPGQSFGDPAAEAEEEPQAADIFHALRDVSFDVRQGETVALIGANGAGKSTMLKLISRITLPSAGRIRINGRVGSLLEIGTGFHPDLTGRDNVYMNGAILGMNRDEVRSKFDDIVSFAGLGKFIDTPVKRYSSGMYVRLAFSVAAFLEPEILIVDEVLAVGDAQFQERCIRRLQQVVKEGRTLLFVSHGAGLVRRVCQRAICLKQGRVFCDGPVEETLRFYEKSVQGKDLARVGEVVFPQGTEPGDHTVKLVACRVTDAAGSLVTRILSSEELRFTVDFHVLVGGQLLRPAAFLKDGFGNILFWTCDTAPHLRRSALPPGYYRANFSVPGDLLAPGEISFCAGVGEATSGGLSRAQVDDVIRVTVEDDMSENSVRGHYTGPLPGSFRPRLRWETKSIE